MAGLHGAGWNAGLYTHTYLTLAKEAMTGDVVFQGKFCDVDFWIAFTDMLNDRIKDSLPLNQRGSFGDFPPHEVTKYGKDLRSTFYQYKDFEDADDVIDHFQLYRDLFQRRQNYPSFPSEARMLGINTKRPRLASGSATPSGSSHYEFSDMVGSLTTNLSRLVNTNIISVMQMHYALEIFYRNDALGLNWLKMNSAEQMEYLNEIYPNEI